MFHLRREGGRRRTISNAGIAGRPIGPQCDSSLIGERWCDRRLTSLTFAPLCTDSELAPNVWFLSPALPCPSVACGWVRSRRVRNVWYGALRSVRWVLRRYLAVLRCLSVDWGVCSCQPATPAMRHARGCLPVACVGVAGCCVRGPSPTSVTFVGDRVLYYAGRYNSNVSGLITMAA